MKITLVGMGMGIPASLTGEALAALRQAEIIIGADRLIANLPEGVQAQTIACPLPDSIADLVDSHPEWQTVCIVVSGDVGFYSAATKLTRRLSRHDPLLLPGISTPQAFAARLRRPWQNFHLVSAHGAPVEILAEVLNHPAVLFLTGGATTPATIATELARADLGEAILTVAENLGSPGEAIRTGTAAEMQTETFASLSTVLVENAKTFTRPPAPPGIEDDAFIRGDTPMTKREIRVQALSLLRPAPDATIYDIGAGTGSVAVEAALQARRGRVYAIEREPDACALIRKNRAAFGAYNMDLIPGSAPDAFAGLPAPDAAFIGGSGGAMREIVDALLSLNPRVRIVASAVTVETLSAAVEVIPNPEVCQIAASRATLRGGLHMFSAVNPVFLISGGGA